MGLLCLLSSFTPTACHHPPKHVSRLHVSLRQFGVQGSTAPVQLNVISPTPHRVIRARGGVRGHVNASTTAPQTQEGQQLPLGTICHGDVPLWPFQRGRLECLCVGRPNVGTHVAPPCFHSGRRTARAKGGSANNTTNTLPGTLAGCWPSSATLRPCTPQASQCGAKSRTARHLRTFPFCCLTNCCNTHSLKARSMTGSRPTPRKWASRASYVSGAHISEWTQHKGTGRACPFSGDSAPFSAKASDSVFLLTWRLLTGCHRKRFWIFAVNKLRLCACGCFGRDTMDAAFQVLAWSCRALLSARQATGLG